MTLADQAARDAIRHDLGTTLIVEAAAGTGKTTELVRRMVAALMAGSARLEQMVAVTFTEPAAGELKLRLRTAIERERESPSCPAEARDRLRAALEKLEEATIGTIHSFCADLLRKRPVEAGVDPLFEVAPDDVARTLFERAFDRWFEAQLARPSPAVARILRRRMERDGGRPSSADGPRNLLRSAAAALLEWRDFPAPWRRQPGFDREAEVRALMEEMAALGARAKDGDPDDWFTKSLRSIERFVHEVERREAIRGRDLDGLEASLVAFSRGRPGRHWTAWNGFQSWPGKQELKAKRAAVYARLTSFVERAGADLAPELRDELWPVVRAYDDLKARAGCLDFLDLLLRARNLVRGDRGAREHFKKRFTHLFVDEFQDTDPLQAEILLLLSSSDVAETDWRRVRAEPGKLFIVGDPRQSIYRFRRADVALYEAIKRQLLDAGARRLDLTVSFRAVPEIQAAVNAAFAPRMTGATSSQPSYAPLAPFRAAEESQPAVVALPVPAPYGDRRQVVKFRIEQSLPDATAAFVDWLVHASGWTVTEPGDGARRVPLEPRHVCLLFRRMRSFFDDVTRPYVRALEARGLPHLLVGGTSFHAREEVEAIRNALRAIERPDDELSLFATLRGPLFALGDGQLLAFRERTATFHPFRRLPEDLPEALAEVADALAVLRELHSSRNRRPIADTIGRLLAATRAHAGFASWPTGEQALANVTRLMDLARRFERSGGTSFRSFVDWLDGEAEHGEASDAPIIEEGTDGVRIMTVHRAKGLEFPVVLLADMTANEAPARPSRWIDPAAGLCVVPLAGCLPPELLEHRDDEMRHEREEADRVLYVATTRARDLLVVPVVGDAPQDGWLGALNPVVYPPTARARRPESASPPGCPAFGHDSVRDRPPHVSRPLGSVAPGLHRPAAGDHRVVWWDPAVLALDKQESVGLAQQKLLAVDETGERSDAGIRAHAAWQAERARVRGRAGTPSLRIATATELAASAAAPAFAVGVERIDVDPARPHGKRFGALVHAVLATVDPRADSAAVGAAAHLQAMLLGAPDAEVEAAIATATRALAHPLLRRAAAAAAAGRCRRETPLAMRREDGSLVEGVADLAFADAAGGAWTVVDFKTDVELSGRLEEYRTQVALYVEALARATSRPATGVLLRV